MTDSRSDTPAKAPPGGRRALVGGSDELDIRATGQCIGIEGSCEVPWRSAPMAACVPAGRSSCDAQGSDGTVYALAIEPHGVAVWASFGRPSARSDAMMSTAYVAEVVWALIEAYRDPPRLN